MQHLNNYINISNRLNFTLRTEQQRNQSYNGFYQPYNRVINLVNLDESRLITTYYNGERLTFKQTIKHTFTHELTHHLQYLDSKYNGMNDLGYLNDIHRNGIYAYNEIVANTIAMLIYPTDDAINDNINYVNFYMKNVSSTSRNTNKQAFNDRLDNDLKNDIDKYYKIIKEQLEIEGLL